MFCERLSYLCNLQSELTVPQIWFFIEKRTRWRVFKWYTAFVQSNPELTRAQKLIFHFKTLKKTCFGIDYQIVQFKCWHLHKCDFPTWNAQKDDLYAIAFVKHKDRDGTCTAPILNWKYIKKKIVNGLLHLYNDKSELTIGKIWFSISQRSKERVLKWIMTFVQFKVSCTNWILHCETLGNKCFAIDYHICVIESYSWYLHKANFSI